MLQFPADGKGVGRGGARTCARGTLGANHVSRRQQVRCVAKTHGDAQAVRHRKLDAPYRLTPLPCGGPARLDPSVELNQGDPPCSSPPWPPGPRQGWAACSDRFWARELRVSQQISTFYEPSVQAMDTQLNARHRRWTPTSVMACGSVGRERSQRLGGQCSGRRCDGSVPPFHCSTALSSQLQFRRKPPGRRRGQGRRKTRCGLKLVVS